MARLRLISPDARCFLAILTEMVILQMAYPTVPGELG